LNNCTSQRNSQTDLSVNASKRDTTLIIIPDNLILYNPYDKPISINSAESINFTLLLSTNSACASCLSIIKKISDNSKKLKESGMDVKIICVAYDEFESFKFFCERGDFNSSEFPFYLDQKKSFKALNKEINYSGYVFLLDRNNRILHKYNEYEIPFDSLINHK